MSVPSIFLFDIDIVRFMIDFGIFYILLLVVSLTLNLEAGYAGVPNFGKVLFVAGGAAAAGSVSGRVAALALGVSITGDYNTFVARIIQGVNVSLSHNALLSMELLMFGLILAAAVGGLLGFFASFPAIRLREDYLGMLLLASAQFFQILLRSYEPLIGGTQGILVPDLFAWAGSEKGIRDVAILCIFGLFAGIVYFFLERMARSPLGRTLRAVRDNEEASRALGKNDVAIRRKVIVIASAISGMAGALLTFYAGSVGAETWTRITWTFWPWVIVIIGGAANNLGVALGAFSFTLILKGVDQVKFKFQPIIPFDVNWLEYLAFATLLIAILILRPEGILPEKSSETLPKYTVAMMMQAKVESTESARRENSETSEGHDRGHTAG